MDVKISNITTSVAGTAVYDASPGVEVAKEC